MKILKIISISVLITIAFSGCNLTDSVSASQRLTNFENNLNSDDNFTSTYTHIHSGMASTYATYAQIKTYNFWNTNFSILERTFTFSVTMSSELDGIITGTGTLYHSTNLDDSVIIKFKENEDDVWYIYSLKRAGSQLF